MNTLSSWIDADAVSGLGRELAGAEAAVDPAAPGGHLPLTKLSADDFRLPENYLPAPFPGPEAAGQDQVRQLLRSIRRKAEHSGLIAPAAPGSEPAPRPIPPAATAPMAPAAALPAAPPLFPTVPYFAPPIGPLGTRIRAYIDWIRRQITCQEVFIVDAKGDPVSERAAAAELVTAAVLMAESARRALKHLPATATEGGVHLDLPDDRKLCVIDTLTNHGAFCLGLVLDDALAPRFAQRLRLALRRAVEHESPRRERW